MKTWKLSNYTQIIEGKDGDVLLHNSFMGAIARIESADAGKINKFLVRDRADRIHGPLQYKLPAYENDHMHYVLETDLANPVLKELCDGGFFMPADVDEKGIVNKIIEKERDETFYQIIILPHENCNFRCTYCYETFAKGKMKDTVEQGLKLFAEKTIPDYSGLIVSWFGGEPLLAKDVIYRLSDSFLDLCDTAGKQYSSNMTTNGYFLTPDVVNELFKRKINRFQITLDGPAKTHNLSRKLAGGGSTFDNIMKNLIGMHHRDDDFQVKVRVNFNSNVYEYMDDFFGELKENFNNDERFDVSFHAVGKWGGPNDEKMNVYEESAAEKCKNELLEKAYWWGFKNETIKKSISSHGSVCYAGKESSICVGSDGVVYKCTVAFEDPVNQVGQITADGDLIIDKSKWDQWVKFDDKNREKCNTCTFSPSCQSRSCPLAAIKDKEPPCPTTNSNYRSLINLAAYNDEYSIL